MGQRVTLSVPNPASPSQDMNIGTIENPLVVTGGGGGTVGTPSISGGEYNSTPPTLTAGSTDALQLDMKGSLRTVLSSPNSGNANGFGVPQDALSNAGASGYFFVTFGNQFNGTTWDRDRKPNQTSRIVSSAATTNATVAKASAGDMFRVSGYNSNAAARYLKIYNKATAPNVGTDVPIWTEYLAPQAKFDLAFPKGLYFSAGISYALVTGSADADTTAVAAGDILALNVAYA